jgi:hypothetical protein
MKTKARIDSLFRILSAAVLLALLPACATSPVNGESDKFGPQFVPTGTLDDQVVLKRASIKRSALKLEEAQIINSGNILNRSPLELVGSGKNLALAQLATKVNVVAYVRRDGEGILASFKKGGTNFAPGFTMGRRIVYPNRESIQKDFPHITPATLDKFIQIKSSRAVLTKWEVSFYWVQSRDGRAFRIFMDQPRYLNHVKPIETDPYSTEDAPTVTLGNALAIFSYRYPVYKEGRLHITSIIFDLTIDANEGAYWGGRQSSGWLPLQQNTKNGPYSLQIGIVEASNFQSFFESVGGVSGIGGKLIEKVF